MSAPTQAGSAPAQASQSSNEWSFERKLSISTLLGVVTQLVMVVVMVTQMRADIQQHGKDIGELKTSMTKATDAVSRVDRLDERLAGVVKGLEALTAKLDRLFDGRRK
jgi:3-methyladenine DNA glycosylase/8-oxoguanine DNA glycosylase